MAKFRLCIVHNTLDSFQSHEMLLRGYFVMDMWVREKFCCILVNVLRV